MDGKVQLAPGTCLARWLHFATRAGAGGPSAAGSFCSLALHCTGPGVAQERPGRNWETHSDLMSMSKAVELLSADSTDGPCHGVNSVAAPSVLDSRLHRRLADGPRRGLTPCQPQPSRYQPTNLSESSWPRNLFVAGGNGQWIPRGSFVYYGYYYVRDRSRSPTPTP